jgi:hypothetical protein
VRSLYLIDYFFIRSKYFREQISENIHHIIKCGGFLPNERENQSLLLNKEDTYYHLFIHNLKIKFELWNIKFGQQLGNFRAAYRCLKESLGVIMPDVIREAHEYHKQTQHAKIMEQKDILLKVDSLITRNIIPSFVKEVEDNVEVIESLFEILFPAVTRVFTSDHNESNDKDNQLLNGSAKSSIRYEFDNDEEDDDEVWNSDDEPVQKSSTHTTTRRLADVDDVEWEDEQEVFEIKLHMNNNKKRSVCDNDDDAKCRKLSRADGTGKDLPTRDHTLIDNCPTNQLIASLGSVNHTLHMDISLQKSLIETVDNKLIIQTIKEHSLHFSKYDRPRLQEYMKLYHQAITVVDQYDGNDLASTPLKTTESIFRSAIANRRKILTQFQDLKRLYLKILGLINGKCQEFL